MFLPVDIVMTIVSHATCHKNVYIQNLEVFAAYHSCVMRIISLMNNKMLFSLKNCAVQEPVENWPLCDCLISFHSKGFPLEKAVMYTELRRPFVINDLYMQYKLQNRSVACSGRFSFSLDSILSLLSSNTI